MEAAKFGTYSTAGNFGKVFDLVKIVKFNITNLN